MQSKAKAAYLDRYAFKMSSFYFLMEQFD